MLRAAQRPLRSLRRGLAVQRFPVPSMGDSITEGTLLELMKKAGDYVAQEEVIGLVETDKVTVEVRAEAAGTITAMLVNVDDTVLVGSDMVEIDVGVGEPTAPRLRWRSLAPRASIRAVGRP